MKWSDSDKMLLCLSRVEAQAEMSMMKEMSGKDLMQYSAETKELERVIAHERRLKEFMNTKCHERAALEDGCRTGENKSEMFFQLGRIALQRKGRMGSMPRKNTYF